MISRSTLTGKWKYFLCSRTVRLPEDMDDDEFEVLDADKMLDLEPLIIAALLVEAPLVPLCRGLRWVVRAVRCRPQRGAVPCSSSPMTACRACPTAASALRRLEGP